MQQSVFTAWNESSLDWLSLEALEVLLSRVADICVAIPTSGGLRPPVLPPRYRNIRHAYHALYCSKSHLQTAW